MKPHWLENLGISGTRSEGRPRRMVTSQVSRGPVVSAPLPRLKDESCRVSQPRRALRYRFEARYGEGPGDVYIRGRARTSADADTCESVYPTVPDGPLNLRAGAPFPGMTATFGTSSSWSVDLLASSEVPDGQTGSQLLSGPVQDDPEIRGGQAQKSANFFRCDLVYFPECEYLGYARR